MPYSYHESQQLSRQNSLALKSLSATGQLPSNHYWNSLRDRYDSNPIRFSRNNNPVINALLGRDQAQRAGTLGASAPLFPNTKFFAYAGGKHALNMARFDHFHPFLGRLFDIILPQTAAQGVIPPAVVPPVVIPPLVIPPVVTPPLSQELPPTTFPPPASDNPETGTEVIPPPLTPTVTVPEPASVMMMSFALFVVGVLAVRTRQRASRRAAGAVPVVVA